MIVLFGPAGAGKTVQGQMLAKKYGWVWLSVGQILRDSHNDAVMHTMSEGHLAPTELVDKVMSDALVQSGENSRIVIDGFPRQLDQAEWLMDFCKSHSREVTLVIVLDVPSDEIMKRLSIRGRADDSAESIAERLSIYNQQMQPILEYFANQNVQIAHIDGVGSVEEISNRISNKLSECNIR